MIQHWTDGYSITIDVTGSVVSYFENSIEAVCFSAMQAGVECMGIKHTAEESVGEPWGLYATIEAMNLTQNTGAELTGIFDSNSWYTTENDTILDAGLGGDWRIWRFLPS